MISACSTQCERDDCDSTCYSAPRTEQTFYQARDTKLHAVKSGLKVANRRRHGPLKSQPYKKTDFERIDTSYVQIIHPDVDHWITVHGSIYMSVHCHTVLVFEN